MNPIRYIEIGSGNSTKFARRAIQDQQLRTQITSIDPHPRATVEQICDHSIRLPVEDVELGLFEELEEDDILFIDNSHRIFTNSDATTVFLDVLPYLKPGVLVQFHDIYLPYDYPEEWRHRYYSEQYCLATLLLADRNRRYEIVLPNWFIFENALSHGILNDPVWQYPSLAGVEQHGGSFWLRVREA